MHGDFTKDVTALPFTHYMGRAVLLKLDTCQAMALITRKDLETADNGRIRPGDVVVLDSNYHAEPFAADPNDQRPHLSRKSAQWFLEKDVKAVGFGDGICIETNIEHCVACHDIMLAKDCLFIEVMQNLDKLESDIFMIVFMPIPIKGLDSSPVNIIAIEGIEAFS